MREQKTTRKRNIWIHQQIEGGRSVQDVAKDVGLPERRITQILSAYAKGCMGPGRPNKPEDEASWEAELGQGFREARNRKGMTMRELIDRAKSAGINADLISRFERGSKQPSMQQLQEMCDIIGVSIKEIWPKERKRSQRSEMRRAAHLRPNELVDISALLGKGGRQKNEPKQVGSKRR